MQSLLTDRWVELLIESYINPKYKTETRISKKSLVFPILFLIYIKEIFPEIKFWLPQVTCLFFFIYQGLLITGHSIIKIIKIIKKIGKITFKWKMHNAVTYNISKNKAILFFKVKNQKLAE